MSDAARSWLGTGNWGKREMAAGGSVYQSFMSCTLEVTRDRVANKTNEAMNQPTKGKHKELTRGGGSYIMALGCKLQKTVA